MIDCAKRLTEVDKILSYLKKEDFEKIPQDIIEVIRENKDIEYTWEYDETKSLKEQEINRDTIIILSYINTNFLLTEKQKELMEDLHKFNEKKKNEELNAKYNYEDMFKKQESTHKKEDTTIEENALVVYKENIFIKIINKIKNIFKR